MNPAAARCVTEVLRALATVAATPAMRDLAVLDEDRPLWAGADTFPAALLDLLGRRVARFGPVIRGPAGLRPPLRAACASASPRCPARIPSSTVTWSAGNILVDDQARPLAVLDFGFLTTAGDPRLDAAITASVMNMYGPHAPAITDALTAQLARDLGYPADVLLTYQAAYAVATSNAFTADGSDGHFAWCMDNSGGDISDLLGP